MIRKDETAQKEEFVNASKFFKGAKMKRMVEKTSEQNESMSMKNPSGEQNK